MGCVNLLGKNIRYDFTRIHAKGTARRLMEWVVASAALLHGGAMAAAARLLATDNRRPPGAKLLSPAQFLELSQLLTLLFGYAYYNQGLGSQVLPAVAGCHLTEHWATAVVGRVQTESLPPACGRRGSRASTDPASQAVASEVAISILQSFNGALINLMMFMSGAPASSGSSYCLRRAPGPCAPAGVAPQLLSGRCLQYFTAVQAVSQLYAAAGGPLYGLPYDALLSYVKTDRQPDVRKGQGALSCEGLRSSVRLWCTCCCLCPPEALRPLRPRHWLSLCLRIARAALASLAWCRQWRSRRRGGAAAGAAGAAAAGTAGRGAAGRA